MNLCKAVACLLFITGDAIAASLPPAPEPSPSVVGPPSYYQLPATGQPPAVGSSQSETYKAAVTAWTQMVSTQYSHVEQWYPKLQPPYSPSNLQQLADCVGMVSYLTYMGAPEAAAELFAYENVYNNLDKGDSKIPTPQQYADFFVSLNGAPTANWQLITSITDIQAGDVLIIPASFAQGTSYVGHALMAAGSPKLLSDGSYALLEFDSTSTTTSHTGGHGLNDTRYWDPRNQPCPSSICSGDSGGGAGNTGPSGLGQGTVQIAPLPASYQGTYPDYPFQIAWFVSSNNDLTSGSGYIGPLIVARPTSPVNTAAAQCMFQWAQIKFPTALTPAGTATTFIPNGMTRTYSGTGASLTFNFSTGKVNYHGPKAGQIRKIGNLQSWLNLSNCQ